MWWWRENHVRVVLSAAARLGGEALGESAVLARIRCRRPRMVRRWHIGAGDKQLGGGPSHAVDGDQRRAGPLDEGVQLGVEVGDLVGERLVAARQGT